MILRSLLQSMVLLLITVAMAGCASYPKSSELAPLELTYIRIGQDQYSTGGLHPQYEGSIAYPYCLHNPNIHDIYGQGGYEVFQAIKVPNNPGLKLVTSADSGREWFRAGITGIPVGMFHNVLLNETLEGGSTDYVVHIWHQILNPEPVHRVDRWFNMTFTPYGPGDTTYTEGDPC